MKDQHVFTNKADMHHFEKPTLENIGRVHTTRFTELFDYLVGRFLHGEDNNQDTLYNAEKHQAYKIYIFLIPSKLAIEVQ